MEKSLCSEWNGMVTEAELTVKRIFEPGPLGLSRVHPQDASNSASVKSLY